MGHIFAFLREGRLSTSQQNTQRVDTRPNKDSASSRNRYTYFAALLHNAATGVSVCPSASDDQDSLAAVERDPLHFLLPSCNSEDNDICLLARSLARSVQ
jgi:hypothetical protein